MVTKEYSEALVEVLEIINCLGEDERKKIPNEIIEFYEKNKSTTYTPNLHLDSEDISKAILKNKTREILAGLYIDYLCDSEDEKKQYEKALKQTEFGYEEEKEKKFEQLPIYKQELEAFYTDEKIESPKTIENVKSITNENQKVDSSRVDDSMALANVEKQNIFVKIWQKIKSFFKK